jgi:hypothetical protein
MAKYGVDESDLDRATEEVDAILAEVARRLGRITYSQLAAGITAISLDMNRPNDRQILGVLLGRMAQHDHNAGRGLRTALAVRGEKDGPFEPNEAFYDWASKLGLDVSDRTSFLAAQYRRVYRDWWQT